MQEQLKHFNDKQTCATRLNDIHVDMLVSVAMGILLAIRDSDTVSIGLEMNGVCIVRFLVNFDVNETCSDEKSM
jgi:hypothetical protein